MEVFGTEIDFNKQEGYFLNADCMEGMRAFSDKYFDLAIVDPIYGDVTQGGYTKGMGGRRTKNSASAFRIYNTSIWDQQKTPKEYFDELFRVSKNQIIWGGNYFVESINKDSQCWLVWDKDRCEGKSYADGELAWTSFNKALRIFKYKWDGMLQENMKDKEWRIHPTQKPVALYEWILSRYAKKGDIILDTHVGSASSLIACHKMGFNYVGFELDENYYKLAKDRLDQETAQMDFYDLVRTNAETQN